MLQPSSCVGTRLEAQKKPTKPARASVRKTLEVLAFANATAHSLASSTAAEELRPALATHSENMDSGDDQLGRARVKLTNVWATMKGVFARAWDHKSVCFFVGSVILMHAFGDELAV